MKSGIKNLAGVLVAILILTVLLNAVMNNSETKMTYTELMVAIQNGTVENIEIEQNRSGLFGTQQDAGGKGYVTLKDSQKIQKQVEIPNVESFMNTVNKYLLENSFELTQKSESFLLAILNIIAPLGILVIFFAFLFLSRASSGGTKNSMSFGKSKARMIGTNEKTKVTFKDVAGVD